MIIVHNLCYDLFYFGMRLIHFKEINIERSAPYIEMTGWIQCLVVYIILAFYVAEQLIRTHYLHSQEASGQLNCVTVDLNHFKLRFLGIQARLVNLCDTCLLVEY